MPLFRLVHEVVRRRDHGIEARAGAIEPGDADAGSDRREFRQRRGDRVRVRNLETGDSEVVEIRDRGPHVPGRIIDVTPRTAEELDMKKAGVATVEVVPLELPGKKTGD